MYHLEFYVENSNAELRPELVPVLAPAVPGSPAPLPTQQTASSLSLALCYLGKGNTSMLKSIHGDILERKTDNAFKRGSITHTRCSSNEHTTFLSLQFLHFVKILLCLCKNEEHVAFQTH